MSSENKKNISIADLISFIAGAVIVGAYFIGGLLRGDNFEGVLGLTIGVALLLGGFMWFMLKAKQATNDFKKWKIVEVACLIASIPVLVYCSWQSATAINYFLHRQELKDAANKNVEFVTNQIDTYRYEQRERLNNTVKGLNNYLSFNLNSESVNPNVTRFIRRDVLRRNNTPLTSGIIDNYNRVWAEAIEKGGVSDTNYIATFHNELGAINRGIDTWNCVQLKDLTNRSSELAQKVNTRLNAASESFNFPVISFDDQHNLSFYPGVTPTYSPITEEDSFKAKYDKVVCSSVGAMGIYVGLVILYLLDYLVVRRSPFRPANERRKKADDLGTVL